MGWAYPNLCLRIATPARSASTTPKPVSRVVSRLDIVLAGSLLELIVMAVAICVGSFDGVAVVVIAVVVATHIVPTPTDEFVIAPVAVDEVAAVTAVDPVVAFTAVDPVPAFSSHDSIRSASAANIVSSAASADQVCTPTGENPVTSGEPDDYVVSGGADQDIGLARSDDRGRFSATAVVSAFGHRCRRESENRKPCEER